VVFVFHDALFARLEDMNVRSGAVSFWVDCVGVRVGVFLLRMRCSEDWTSEAIRSLFDLVSDLHTRRLNGHWHLRISRSLVC